LARKAAFSVAKSVTWEVKPEILVRSSWNHNDWDEESKLMAFKMSLLVKVFDVYDVVDDV
jgi:hypothetical protein